MNDLQTAMANVDQAAEARRPKIAIVQDAPAVGVAAVGEALSDASVDHPPHYGGADDPYETIKVIEAWGLDFHLGNSIKYISRAGKKYPTTAIDDLRKAAWYLDREIANRAAVVAKALNPEGNGG